MNFEELSSIVDAFRQKASDYPDYLMEHGVISDNRHRESIGEVRHAGLSIFDGAEGDSQKVASLHFQGNGKIFLATLYVGDNEFKFMDNPSLCIELIERFVKIPQKTIQS